MVAMRESVGEFVKLPVARRKRSKPQKIESLSSGRSAVLAARAIAGRRGSICDSHFESEGTAGRANHEGLRRPGRPTLGRAESGMAVAFGPNRDGQVATAPRRSRTLGLPVPTQAKRRISARQSRSDGDTCRVCKRAICRCSNRSRQQPWRPRRWQSGARRIRPCWGRSIQWN